MPRCLQPPGDVPGATGHDATRGTGRSAPPGLGPAKAARCGLKATTMAIMTTTRGEAVPAGARRPYAALATLSFVLFLTFLDNTIVSVVLASVQGDLHAGVSELQWVVNGYALVFASLMLTFGTLGDLFGRKKIMLAGVGVFCAGSVIAALAPDVHFLIAGRAVMGLGAAASEPGTLSMIRQLYPDRRERARA